MTHPQDVADLDHEPAAPDGSSAADHAAGFGARSQVALIVLAVMFALELGGLAILALMY